MEGPWTGSGVVSASPEEGEGERAFSQGDCLIRVEGEEQRRPDEIGRRVERGVGGLRISVEERRS